MKLLIGHVGEPLAGKETVGNIIADWARKNGFTEIRHRFSDILNETLKILADGKNMAQTIRKMLAIWNLPATEGNISKMRCVIFAEEAFGNGDFEANRCNLQKLGQAMTKNDAFGNMALSNAIKARLLSSDDLVQADGVRWPSDEKLIRSLGGVVIYTTASIEERWRRLSERNRGGKEKRITRDEFARQNQAANEIFIPQIGVRADWKIVNEMNREELEREVLLLCEKLLRRKLPLF